MSAWNELLNETKAAGSTHDIIRRRYLNQLFELTGRNIIVYYSGWLQKPALVREPAVRIDINDADKNGFMSVIHGMDRSKGLDLILHTPGGDIAATESLVDYLRAMFQTNIRAIVPQIAMSGGTLIALSCREIIMGKESSIGPIDPQFGRMGALNLLQEFERIKAEIKNDPSAALLWQPILRQIEPGFITECENSVNWARSMAQRFLETNMLAAVENKAKRAKKIVSQLTEKRTTMTHGRHIGLDEAQKIIGEAVVPLEKDNKFQDAVLTVHHSCIITLDATPCYKLIENHTGRAFLQMARPTLVAGG